ncbi:hypothetical protein RZN22_08050 [Bacillaceae bacterium S4-13-58]
MIATYCFICYYTMMTETFGRKKTDYSRMYLDMYNQLEIEIVDCEGCGRRVRYEQIDNGKYIEIFVPLIKTNRVKAVKWSRENNLESDEE